VAQTFPVSIKGVCVQDGQVLLLRNERDEWELPGGRLERGESPAECVEREVEEELGLFATAERLLDTWVLDVAGEGAVLIITYGCAVERPDPLAMSDEHSEAGLFPISDLDSLRLPAGYADSIATWQRLLAR
jgi:ADP-ribose pyrophosphatase YjhB (NUDIX family)